MHHLYINNGPPFRKFERFAVGAITQMTDRSKTVLQQHELTLLYDTTKGDLRTDRSTQGKTTSTHFNKTKNDKEIIRPCSKNLITTYLVPCTTTTAETEFSRTNQKASERRHGNSDPGDKRQSTDQTTNGKEENNTGNRGTPNQHPANTGNLTLEREAMRGITHSNSRNPYQETQS